MTDALAIDWQLLWLPLAAGIGTALLAGPLGCFVVWQRMAYFGESLAHSALLGVALGLWFRLPPALTVLGTGIALALLLVQLQQRSRFSSDTLLGILSHTLLAAGLVLRQCVAGPLQGLVDFALDPGQRAQIKFRCRVHDLSRSPSGQSTLKPATEPLSSDASAVNSSTASAVRCVPAVVCSVTCRMSCISVATRVADSAWFCVALEIS